jgi:hypothetical protein
MDFVDLCDEDGFHSRTLQTHTALDDRYTNVKDTLKMITGLDTRGTVEHISELRGTLESDLSLLDAFCWSAGAIVNGYRRWITEFMFEALSTF